MNTNPIPDSLKPFFWDVDTDKVDIYEQKQFVIERLLKYGTVEAVKWVLATYKDEDIIETVKKSRNLDRKTANYWAIHYGINKDEVRCLNMPLIQDCFY